MAYLSQLRGTTDAGTTVPLNATPEGHLEVAIHAPILPFGSVHAEKMTPVFQVDAVYGLNTTLVSATTGLAVGIGANSATATAANNLFTCSTGTTAYSFGTIQSRRRLRYRPGQGVVGRFTAIYSTPAASTVVVAGYGTAESGLYFGYNGTAFGILHVTDGTREIQTLTITTASTATNNYVVTLPDTTTANVTATNNGSTTQTAYEISRGTFPGWSATAVGSTVIFVNAAAKAVSGTFSLAQTGAGTPAAGACVETVSGAASTDTWYPQTTWNGDKLDGSGASGFTLNPAKGNVYQINIQYLGFGDIEFYVEVNSEGNNSTFVLVHTIQFSNTRTTPTLKQPSFPYTMAAYSAGSTTNVSVSTASFAGFVEGEMVKIGPRQSYYNNNGVSSSTSAYTPIFTVKNGLVFANRPNQCVSHLLSVHGACKSTTGLTTFFLIRNATLTGPVNFASWATDSATQLDTGATGCSFATNNLVIWSGTLAESSDFNYTFNDNQITLQPGETATLAVRSVTATATCVGSLDLREDQ